MSTWEPSEALNQIENAVGHLESDENVAALTACLAYCTFGEVYSALKAGLDKADLDALAAALEADGFGEWEDA